MTETKRTEMKATEIFETENVTKKKKNSEIGSRDKAKGISNSKKKDSFGKTIFGNNVLCAQFLRKYTNISQLKNVQPEDIEDISNRFTHMFTEEREADVVKKINIGEDEMPFYLISLIEHKSKVDYDVVMQILRYMVYIWEDYEKRENEKKKGISKTKNFRYPPILPIIYYDGIHNWTAALRLKERIYLSDVFTEFIPDYECMLIPIHKYSNQKIMEGKNDLAVLILLDKLRDLSDFKKLSEEVPPEYFAEVTENTPQNVMDIMTSVVSVLLSKLKLSEGEIDSFMKQIKEEGNVGGWFEHFKEIDLPAERRKIREEERKAAREEARKEVREEVRGEVREEVRGEVREEVRGEVREEVREEVRGEIREEVREEVRGEIREEDYKIFIETLEELNVAKEIIIEKLVDKYSLTREEAEEKINL